MEPSTYAAIIVPVALFILLIWLYSVVAEMRAETQGGGFANLRAECFDWKFHVIVICYPIYIPVAFCFQCCGKEKWLAEHLDWYYLSYICSNPCRRRTKQHKDVTNTGELPMYARQSQQLSENPYPEIERPSPAAVFPTNSRQ